MSRRRLRGTITGSSSHAPERGLKILIAGGGIGGLCAALCLAKANVQVEVFEQAPALIETGAGIQLSPNATRVLHHLGLEAALQDQAFLPKATRFRSWRSGKLISETALGAAAVEQYGAPYYHIHRGDLLALLARRALQEPGITLHTGAPVETLDQAGPERVALTVAGNCVEGDALIGADGIHSKVRTALWGAEQARFTGNVAWRALVPAAALPADAIAPTGTVWWGPGKHFVHYFVRRGTLVNCVCVVEKDGWDVESWTTPGDHQELRADFAGWHRDVQMLIEHADPASLYKWALYDRPPMARWGRERVTLLGDACHPTLPFMAQGAAMAMEDAAVLAHCLSTGNPVPAALQRYEQLRRERTAQIQLGSRRNAKVFHLRGMQAWTRDQAASTMGSRTMDRIYRYNALQPE
jgi:salicylate hydroxylase